jgi:hypothetical protein
MNPNIEGTARKTFQSKSPTQVNQIGYTLSFAKFETDPIDPQQTPLNYRETEKLGDATSNESPMRVRRTRLKQSDIL